MGCSDGHERRAERENSKMVSCSLPKVIVTDPHMVRHALPVVRSLGRRGIYVTCLYKKTDFLKQGYIGGAASKYCKNLVISEDILSDIIELSQQHKVLIPISNSTIDLVSKNLGIISEHISVPIPNFQHGIPTPTTYFIDDFADIERVNQNIPFPAIIKFRDELIAPYPRWVAVNSQEELIREYKRMHEIQNYPIIQEYIKGKGVGFFALYNKHHEPRAIFCHERLREYPPDGGQSGLCRSICDDELVTYGDKVLSTLRWYGVAMVEFKLDQDRKLKLMEVNPRFWGSLQLAILAGVDFPWLLYKLALCGDVDPVINYKENVMMRYLSIELCALNKYIRSVRQNKIGYVVGLIKEFCDRNIHEGLLARDDLKPLVNNCLGLPRRIIAFSVRLTKLILARIRLPIKEMRDRGNTLENEKCAPGPARGVAGL
jgi:predicted ATP-grasp superfamily ATP-dependent carboligase